MPEVRLIDSETLKSRIGELCINNDDLFSAKAYERIIGVIEATPIIEAEPVRHGEWILCEDQSGVDNDNNNYAYFCSQCHHQDVHSKFAKVNFCWNCGSKMQAEQPESEVQDDD